MENFSSPIPLASLNNTTSPTNPPAATAVDAAPSMLDFWQMQAQQEEDNDLRNMLAIVKRRAIVITGVAALVMTLMTGQTLKKEAVFRGSFRVLVEPVSTDDNLSDITAALGEQTGGQQGLDYATQMQVLRSPELLEPIAQELSKTYPELTYLTLLANLNISRVDSTKILEVSYTGSDPAQIQRVLDEFSKKYLQYSLEERQTNLRQGINFVEKQLPSLQSQVDLIQDQLEKFRRDYNFITPEIQSSQLSTQVTSLGAQRLSLDRQLAEIQQTFDGLNNSAGAVSALDGASVYEQLLGELRSVETKIAEELTRFSPDSLSIKVLEEQRDNIVPLLQQEAERVVGTKQAAAASSFDIVAAQSQTLGNAEQTVQQGLSQLPSLIRQYTDLQRELEVSTAALTRFRVTREQLEIKAAQTEIPWQLIEAPVKPDKPISPNLQRSLLLSLIASILAGLAIAMLIEKLDNVYHSVDELKAGTKLPILGTVPFNRDLKDNLSAQQNVLSRLTSGLAQVQLGKTSNVYGYGDSGETSFLEALRVLHTNIRMLSSDRPIRSIIMSSALPGDGKSTIAANLAQVATAMGQRVLVVDVDLRKPQVHERLNVSNKVGLSNLIADDLPVKSAIQQLTPGGQLFVLTAGKIPPDPTKLLASQKMQQLMGTFERCFDLVIYDAPPTTGLADVSLIGQRTDGLVLVSRMAKTDRTVLAKTVETLRMAQIPTLGIVANGVKATRYSGYRYYAYGSAAENDTPTAQLEFISEQAADASTPSPSVPLANTDYDQPTF